MKLLQEVALAKSKECKNGFSTAQMLFQLKTFEELQIMN